MKNSSRNGVVLFIVTIVIALIALSAYGFVVLMQGEYRAARLRGDTIQTEAITDSAIEYSMSLIELPRYQRDALRIENNQEVFRNVVVDRTNFANRNGQFSIVSLGRTETMQRVIRFGFANESAKLPLAAILKWDEQSPGAGRQALLQIPRMTDSTADAILDWIDDDSEVREFGAEDLFYNSLTPPRKPANRIPTLLHELLSVRGVTRGLLYGVDANRNGRFEAHERPNIDQEPQPNSKGQPDSDPAFPERSGETSFSADDDDNLHYGWQVYITVTSRERNANRFGKPRINVNSKDLTTLHRQLKSTLDEKLANFIIAYRQYGPSESLTDSPSDSDIPRPSSKSAQFEIDSLVSLLTVQVAIGKDKEQQVFESPLKDGSQDGFSGEFDASDIFDSLTLSDDKSVQHRINILLAPREVLAAIPGLTAESIDAILVARAAIRSDEPKPAHPYWFVRQGALDVNKFQQWEPYMTHGGDVFKAQIVSYYDKESPWDRGEVMIDGSGQSPQAVYYTSLNHLGRGFAIDEILVPLPDGMPSDLDPMQNPAYNADGAIK